MRLLLVIEDDGRVVRGGGSLRNAALGGACAQVAQTRTFRLRSEQQDAGCTKQCSECAVGARGKSYAVYYCRRSVDRLKATVLQANPDVVIVSDLRLHHYYFAIVQSGIPLVVDMHNAESDLTRQQLARREQWGISRDDCLRGLGLDDCDDVVGQVACLEEMVYGMAAGVTVTCEADAQVLIGDHGLSIPTVVVPNAVDVPESPPEPHVGSSFVFSGVLDYLPNRRALVRLVDDILPALRRHIPDAELLVAGRNLPEDMRLNLERSRIEYVDGPTDIVPHLLGRMLLAPIDFGGGGRLKILQALSLKLGVVATGLAVDGIPELEDGVHYLRAERSEEFVDAVLRMLEDPASELARRQSAFSMVAENYSIPSTAVRLRRLLDVL